MAKAHAFATEVKQSTAPPHPTAALDELPLSPYL
jgi:hypothetical protein